MKRIGIVTFFSNNNYGSVLQAYALSRYLSEKGYETEIIDYLTPKNPFNFKIKIGTMANRLWVLLLHPRVWRTALQGKTSAKSAIKALPAETVLAYRRFIEEYLKPYQGTYHRQSDFDAFVCGSDQIWQISAPGLSDIFFLRFTTQQKRIAYAASLGSVAVPHYNAKRLKKYLNGFRAISVREKASEQLITELYHREATHVIDPTLLVGREFWERITETQKKTDRYILCYFLDACTGSEKIVELAKKNGLQVLWIETGTESPHGANRISPSPIEFVSLLKNADVVFTDSFHACCFSSLFEKNFYVVRRNYRGYPAQHVRIEELMHMLQMQDRHIESCAELDALEPISGERYEIANRAIAELRKTSIQFLENAL